MHRFIGFTLILLSAPAWAADEAADNPIEADAVELLQAATGRLAEIDTFLMRSRVEFDSLQDDGQMLEFGASRTVRIDRPDKARIETRRRDGHLNELTLDGNRLWYYTPGHNAYGTASQPGDIGVSLEFVARELGVQQPLADLLASDPYRELTEGLTSAWIVGESEIDGVACLHAAYRNDVGDLQVWISDTDTPALQRLVMTYRDEPGQPQLRADLVEFDFDPDFGPETFQFTPPDDAERIRFIVPGDPETSETPDANATNDEADS
jgi:hypothetical protein